MSNNTKGIINSLIKDKTIELVANARLVIYNQCPYKINKKGLLSVDHCQLDKKSLKFKVRTLKAPCLDKRWTSL